MDDASVLAKNIALRKQPPDLGIIILLIFKNVYVLLSYMTTKWENICFNYY